MAHYDKFIFESFKLDPKTRTITLNYSLDGQVHFSEVFTLSEDLPLNVNHPDLNSALFALHLSGGVSYYKTYCPKIIEVRSGQLNKAQAAFWNKLYTDGLGQFFYENQLDFRGLINFPVTSTTETKHPGANTPKPPTKALLPFGGGKDSVVTSELLRSAGINQTLFRLRRHKLITKLASIANLPIIEIDRALAPELFELNKTDAYNGHVPITAHISFLSIVVGLLAGYDSVFFSNERSSSYGSVDYLGMEVNHQWSKGLEAETMLANYMQEFITHDFQYLNVVRPLSELHIARLFSQHPQYFDTATSCNRNWVLTERDSDAPRWCGTCPKCAFSFALFAAFLPSATVASMFGQNLFENANLLPLYRELWGMEGFKPFECVGTPGEAQAALYLASNKAGFAGTVVMNEFSKRVLPTMKNPEALVQELLTPDTSDASSTVTNILKKAQIL